jgi:hypothetical protein
VCIAVLRSNMLIPDSLQAQTPQQRRANAKFFKEQEVNRGKSREEIKKKTKETFKSPISPLWLGM